MAGKNLGLPAEHGINDQQKEVFMIPAGWERKSQVEQFPAKAGMDLPSFRRHLPGST